MSPAGTVEQIVALTNVAGFQQEWRKGTNPPVQSRFSAEMVTADFFPATNQIREAVAERDVVIVEDQRRARADRAVFTGTNNVVEFTGNPTAESPIEGKITHADVLFWDRGRQRFSGRNLRMEGIVPRKGTNQTTVPLAPQEK